MTHERYVEPSNELVNIARRVHSKTRLTLEPMWRDILGAVLGAAQVAGIWEKADETVLPDINETHDGRGPFYLVITNGDEWGDHNIHVMHYRTLVAHMRPHMVRGRPKWVMKIVLPE